MKYILLSILVLVTFNAPAQGQGRDLKALIALAEQSSPALKASLARYEAAKARATQFGYLEDPKLGAGYFLQSVETRVGPQRATVSVSQMFPWFGTLDAREKSAAMMAEASYQQYLDERNRIAYDIASVYNRMYAVQRSGEAVDGHVGWLNTFREVLVSRYENGRAGFSDILRIEMELQTLENRRLEFDEKRLSLEARLVELTGAELTGTLHFPDTLEAPSAAIDAEHALTAIRQRNPSLQRYDRLREAWAQSGRAARKMGLPSFTLGATYTFIDERDDIVMSDNGKDAIILPQIGISVPLFRGKYNAMEEEALRQEDAARAEREAAERSLEAQAAEAFEALRNAQRNVELYRTLSELSQQTRDIIIEEYTTDKAGIENIIQVERQVVDYQLNLAKARADLNTSMARIEYLTGTRGMENE